MRRTIAILGILILGAAGCHHVGGKCDCGPKPGEAGIYAPYPTNAAPQAESIAAPKAMPK